MFVGKQDSLLRYFSDTFFSILPFFLLAFGVAATLFIQHPVVVTFLLGILISIIGFVLFLFAKLKKTEKGKLFSFGPGQMDKSEKRLYYLGYTLQVLGLIVQATVVWNQSRSN